MNETNTSRMPAAFLGHGNPMNALEQNRYSEAWRAFGASVPRPRAILVISAHWLVNASAVTAMAKPRTIHDFYGFPPALFAVQYPAPGSPEIALEIAEIVKPHHIGLDADSWGLDHGAWSLLVHAFPNADIPVLQLSLHGAKDFAYHLDLGMRLAPLRERGVLIVGSGNVVHNLRSVVWSRPEHGFDWATRFDEAVRTIMTERPSELPRVLEHPDYARSVPTNEHFLPLLYVAGLAAAAEQTTDVWVEGYAYGSLSMTSYALEADPHSAAGKTGGRASQAPGSIPAEHTNL